MNGNIFGRDTYMSIKSNLPPAMDYLINPGDKFRVYRENAIRCEGPFKVKKSTPKIISSTDGTKVK